MFSSGGIDKQYRAVMGSNKFQRSTLLVSMSKYGRKPYICRKKETLPFPKNYPEPLAKLPKFSWPPSGRYK